MRTIPDAGEKTPAICPACWARCVYDFGTNLYRCETHGRIVTDEAVQAREWDRRS